MLLEHIIRAFAIELPFSKIKIFVVILSKLFILSLIYAYTLNKIFSLYNVFYIYRDSLFLSPKPL